MSLRCTKYQKKKQIQGGLLPHTPQTENNIGEAILKVQIESYIGILLQLGKRAMPYPNPSCEEKTETGQN